jgi:hypothetical protein
LTIALVACEHRVFEGSNKGTWRTLTVYHELEEAKRCFYYDRKNKNQNTRVHA